jgi:hypothetical protein
VTGTRTTTRIRRFFAATAVATLVVGLGATGIAHADPMLSVTPSTGLTDGQFVTVELSGFTPDPLASVQIAECGNAFADGTPLSSPPSTTPGELDAANCEVITFKSEGQITADPLTITDVPIQQTGIGTGNRSCVAVPPALAPCFVYVSTSVNLPPFSQVPISFGDDPSTMEPAPTTATVDPVGDPLGEGKTAHALVRVTTANPFLRPEGTVEVYEGATLLGSGTLNGSAVAATADVSLGVLPLGTHTLRAEYFGNGSFEPSTSADAEMSVIDADHVTVSDASMVEGDVGTRSVVFSVVLSHIPAVNVTMTATVVATGSDPATIGTDVLALTKPLTFYAGKQTVKYVTVKVPADDDDEADETFAVQVSNVNAASGFVFRKSEGAGTILDDDDAPASGVTAELGVANVPEGDNGGVRSMKFTVSLSEPVPTDTIVFGVVSKITAVKGSRASGGDWGGAVVRKIVFRAGQVSRPLTVPAFPDTVHELDLYIQVRLTSVTSTSGVTLGTHIESVGTILSDE